MCVRACVETWDRASENRCRITEREENRDHEQHTIDLLMLDIELNINIYVDMLLAYINIYVNNINIYVDMLNSTFQSKPKVSECLCECWRATGRARERERRE